MLKVETYADPKLQELWEGYVSTEHWTVFFPRDGGKPLVFPNEMVQEEVIISSSTDETNDTSLTAIEVIDDTVWLTNDSGT